MDNILEDDVDAYLYDEGDTDVKTDKTSSKDNKGNKNEEQNKNKLQNSTEENKENNDNEKSKDLEMTETPKDSKTEEEVEEEEEEEEEEDDSDSDIEIIMNPEPQEDPKQKLQFNKPTTKEQANGMGKSTVDINAPGQYEGQNIYDVDLDSFEEKPWRKPGSDITDYFNYGFNEQTWRAYCLKQKQIREENNLQKRINVYESGSNEQDMGFGEQQPSMGRSGRGGFINENSRMNANLSRKMLREQDDSVIQVMSGDNHDGKSMPIMPMDSMKMNSRMENDYMGNPMNSHSYPMPDFNMPPDGMGMFGNDPAMNGPPQFWGPEMDPMGPMGYDFPQQQRGRGNMTMRNMPGPMQMRNMPGQYWDNNQHNSNNQMNRMQQHNYNNFNQGRNKNNNNNNNNDNDNNSMK
jgi:hypothetical protein